MKIDHATLEAVKPHLEIDLDFIEQHTAERLQAIRAYLADPGADVTGLRLDTLIQSVESLKRTYETLESSLKRLQGDASK